MSHSESSANKVGTRELAIAIALKGQFSIQVVFSEYYQFVCINIL